MAKINHVLADYREALVSIGLPSSESVPPKAVIRRFVRIFREIDDSRLQGMVDYPLEEILLIAFLAVLGNASTWTEIELFGKTKQRWLKKFIRLKNGIPSHDTFRRVFALIAPGQLQTATVDFLLANLQEIKKSLSIKEDGYRHICIDGKEERSTGRKYQYDSEKVRNLQTLHVYDASNGICLCSTVIDKKTNEIPVAQEILKKMTLKGCIITFDALHTQKETIRIIAEQKGDYVGGLKGNQQNLQKEAEELFTEKVLKSIKGTKDYYETSEKAHGKVEIRRFYMKKVKRNSTLVIDWKNLRNFVCYEKYTCDVVSGEEKTEIRYYITSLKDVETAAQAIRGHWGVENNLHWHLDASFQEDMNATMDKNAFNNLSLMNKMALSLIKLAQPLMKCSVKAARKSFGWGLEDSLAMVLSCFDALTIKKAIENTK